MVSVHEMDVTSPKPKCVGANEAPARTRIVKCEVSPPVNVNASEVALEGVRALLPY